MNLSFNARSGPVKVITTFIDGRHFSGFVLNFSPIRDTCQIFPWPSPYAGESQPQLVNIRQIKGIFFVKEFIKLESQESDEFVGPVQGRKIEVIFTDGKVLVGSTIGYAPTRPGFFVIPAKSFGNILRIFVSNANVRQVRRVQLERGKTEATGGDRRSPRVPLQASIQVTWRDESGKPHAETTTTEVVNAHGALLTLRNPRVPGSELEVTNLATHVRARVQVVCAGSPSPQRGIEVGIELADPNEKFWMANSHG